MIDERKMCKETPAGTDDHGEATRQRGQLSVLVAIDFERLLVDMFRIGADGLERITGESLAGEPLSTNLLSGCRTEE